MHLSEGSCQDKFPGLQQISEIETMNDDVLPRDRRERGGFQYQSLNRHQEKIVDLVLNAVMHDNEPNNHNCNYIDGPGGSGITFICSTLCHILKTNAIKIRIMAVTGIVATILPNGKTVHNSIFIRGEAPLAPKNDMELVDRTLRDIIDNDSLLEGKIIVLGGDSRQYLPVKNRATRCELVDLSIKLSSL